MLPARPLVAPTIAFAVGIGCAANAAPLLTFPPARWLLLLPLLGWLVALAFFALTRKIYWRNVVLTLTWALFGAVLCWMNMVVLLSDVSRLAPNYVTVTGVVQNEPELPSNRPDDAEKTRIRFVLAVETVRWEPLALQMPAEFRSASGVVQASLPFFLENALDTTANKETNDAQERAKISLPRCGDLIVVRGRLAFPELPRNPGAFDSRARLARQGIYALLIARRPEDWFVIAPTATLADSPCRLAMTLRRWTLQAPRGHLSTERAAVLNAVLLGARNEIPPQLREDFERTGTAHIISTAGLHVGMLVVLLLAGLRLARLPRRVAIALVLLALPMYALMAGERASVVRAAIMASVALIGILLEREPDPINTLFQAALILLLLNPRTLFDPGFQLSFATVLTIILLLPLADTLGPALRQRIPIRPPQSPLLRVLAHRAGEYFVLALAAQAGAMPLVAYYFHDLSFIGVVANTLVVWTVPLLLALGFLAVPLQAVPVLPLLLYLPVNALLAILIGMIHACAGLPFASLNVPAPSIPLMCAYYALLWGGAIYYARPAARPLLEPTMPGSALSEPDVKLAP